MLQNMGMVSITTCRMVEFMNEFGFAEHTKIFEKNPGVFGQKPKSFINSTILHVVVLVVTIFLDVFSSFLHKIRFTLFCP